MTYRNELGIMGNIKLLFERTTHANDEVISTKETVQSNKASYDADHIAMEQLHTEADLQNIEAQQALTDMDLRLIALESEVQA